MLEYKGQYIHRCEMADWREHGGKWAVVAYHSPTGQPWADQHCPHYLTLRDAKEAIRLSEEQEKLTGE